MKIKALASRYQYRLGEWPGFALLGAPAESFYGRNPFDDTRFPEISENLLIPEEGTLNGHNTLCDTTIWDGMRVDPNVPLSPLFVRDLAGRTIYIGFGPERKTNIEWMDYIPNRQPDGSIAESDFNPYIPLCTFPRFCRDVQKMEGAELVEQVFLTKFRCLDMAQGFNALPSGGNIEEDDLVAPTYIGANLYPYKVRLDTFYTDGYKLPQTQMLFARGEAQGVNLEGAQKLGDNLLQAWRDRPAGQGYEVFLEEFGETELERMFTLGCTLIPTLEGCNGVNVVNAEFGLEDYWPGRSVLGLHLVMDRRKDKAPEGTILQVLAPGYITAEKVVPAQVIVSDGSGYVSPNAADPMPLIPNMHLPHQRTIAEWRATWLPTHPGHFESPALWGWEPSTGRFLQLSGPLWDPLHYFYSSVDEVLKAFNTQGSASRLVPVPPHMHNRFYPVVPMMGFDTFSLPAYKARQDANALPISMGQRVPTLEPMAGIGYHPLPPEFEFELDPFWFPEFHPLNREQGDCGEDLMPRLAPVIRPRVTVSLFTNSVDTPEADMPWTRDTRRLMTPEEDPLRNYPFLARYIIEDLEIDEILRISPMPFLSDPGDQLKLPADAWWLDEDTGRTLDDPMAMEELAPGAHDALWDIRQQGVDLVKFRHMVHQTNLPLYILAWWYGSNIEMLNLMVEDWMESDPLAPSPLQQAADAMANAQAATGAERAAQGGFVGMAAPEEIK